MSSSTRSFISSLSIDGSVANMDGNGSAFHLLGAAHFSYQNSQQHKRKKHRVKRSVKVPVTSNKLANIPPHDQ
ncbi:putative WRKY transcription factor 21 [Glycine max]|nr:putative WRKY transcription factor 21 [Glycine max]